STGDAWDDLRLGDLPCALWQAQTTSRALTLLLTPPTPTPRVGPRRPRTTDPPGDGRTWPEPTARALWLSGGPPRTLSIVTRPRAVVRLGPRITAARYQLVKLLTSCRQARAKRKPEGEAP